MSIAPSMLLTRAGRNTNGFQGIGGLQEKMPQDCRFSRSSFASDEKNTGFPSRELLQAFSHEAEFPKPASKNVPVSGLYRGACPPQAWFQNLRRCNRLLYERKGRITIVD